MPYIKEKKARLEQHDRSNLYYRRSSTGTETIGTETDQWLPGAEERNRLQRGMKKIYGVKELSNTGCDGVYLTIFNYQNS